MWYVSEKKTVNISYVSNKIIDISYVSNYNTDHISYVSNNNTDIVAISHAVRQNL